jgi:hypothetical protein
MRRREFITLLGSTLAVPPIVAQTQQNRKVPHIGYLMDRSGPPGVATSGWRMSMIASSRERRRSACPLSRRSLGRIEAPHQITSVPRES